MLGIRALQPVKIHRPVTVQHIQNSPTLLEEPYSQSFFLQSTIHIWLALTLASPLLHPCPVLVHQLELNQPQSELLCFGLN